MVYTAVVSDNYLGQLRMLLGVTCLIYIYHILDDHCWSIYFSDARHLDITSSDNIHELDTC